jgi:hypothetical protein
MSDEQRHRPGRGQRSTRCGDPPPPRLRRGVEQFNRGEFFEQHETLELEWLAERDPVRYLYQGILQIGVGVEHLRRGNARGAAQLLRRRISYLEPFKGGCMRPTSIASSPTPSACGVRKLGRRSKPTDLQRDRIYAPHRHVLGSSHGQNLQAEDCKSRDPQGRQSQAHVALLQGDLEGSEGRSQKARNDKGEGQDQRERRRR